MVTRGEMMLMGEYTAEIMLSLCIRAIEKANQVVFPIYSFLTWKRKDRGIGTS